MTPPKPRKKHLVPEPGVSSYYEYRERWAVLVGVSKHKHAPTWDLDFARRDAEELAALLKQAAYGAFDESRMCLLLDEGATTANLTKALRSFLKKPAPSDLVLIYFSCHGTPDPDGQDEVYLVSHDTDPADIAATALPMREVRYALEHTLKAERVVTLADTCHSAALVGGGRKAATPNAQVMKQYLQRIGESKKGRAWLMSAEANEVSLEDARWGGGHGLFTHLIIEGLRGAADTSRRGLIRVGDLFDFVYERVVAESENRQHPSKGAEVYDRDLVLAVTAHLHVHDHFRLGCLLERMGWLTDDPRRFESATRQLALAFNLAAEAGEPIPEAAVRCGLARLAVAAGEHALSWLDKAENAAAAAAPPDLTALADARFHRPLALLDLARPLREPVGALDEFLQKHGDDPRAACAREMRERINRVDRARRRALLIGVGRYQDSRVTPLAGPGNDVRELRKVLVERYAFAPADVTSLVDEAATRADILNALEALARQAGPDDIVVVYFSGHGIEGKEEPYWIPYDASWEHREFAVTASDIDSGLRAIPASKTIAVIDTHPNDVLLDLARRDSAYTLLLAATPGDVAYETPASNDIGAGPHGAFTWGLLQALRQVVPAELTPKHILKIATQELVRLGFHTAQAEADRLQAAHSEGRSRSGGQQTPLLVGEAEEILFRGLIDFPALFRFSRRRHYGALSREKVEQFGRWARSLNSPFPRLRRSLGRAYLELGQLKPASLLLEQAEAEPPPRPESDDADHGLEQCCVHLADGRGQEAKRCLDALRAGKTKHAAEDTTGPWTALADLVERGGVGRRALLVGINGYLAPEVPNPRGAVADVDALATVLKERWGFTDIEILTDLAATRAAILHRFQRLVEWSKEVPCLFAFSGLGSVDAQGRPSLVAADSRLRPDVYDDIDLEDLVGLARKSSGHLVAILDAGWTRTFGPPKDEEKRSRTRNAPPNTGSRMNSKHLTMPRSADGFDLQIGQLAIYSSSLGVEASSTSECEGDLPDPELPTSSNRRTFGQLSHALISSLWRLDPNTTTWSDWLTAAANGLRSPPLTVRSGDSDDARLFGPPPSEQAVARVVELLTRIECEPIAELIPRLKRLIEAQDLPEAMLNLGLAYATTRAFPEAVKSLREAKEHKNASLGLKAEAAYHLGRVLYVAGLDLDEAVSVLRETTQMDASLTGAYYYLGRALRDSARRNLHDQSAAAFRKYLDDGATLGRADEVRHFLELSPSPSAGPAGNGRIIAAYEGTR